MRRLVLAALLAASGANGWSIWQPAGPVCPWIRCGAMSEANPSVVYIVGWLDNRPTAYRTTDRGQTWTQLVDSLPFGPEDVVFQSGSDATLLAAGGQAWESDDCGSTWQRLQTPDYSVWHGVCVSPHNPEEVWLAGAVGAGVGGRAALALSRDGGSSWEVAVCDSSVPSSAYAVQLSPTDSSTVMATGFAEHRSVFYRSDDRAAHWTRHIIDTAFVHEPVCQQPSEEPVGGRAHMLSIDPTGDSVVCVAVRWRGIFRTTDGGRTWTHVLTNWHAHGLARSPSEPSLMYAALSGSRGIVSRSSTGGATWGPPNLEDDWMFGWVGVPADSGTHVWAAAGSGVAVSRDRGYYSDPVFAFTNAPVTALGAWGRLSYAAVRTRGIYVLDEDGRGWQRCAGFPGSDSVVGLVADDSLSVWVLGKGGVASSGPYHSSDAGRTWARADTWLTVGGAIVAARQLPGFVVATGTRDEGAGTWLGVAVTSDSGATWRHVVLDSGVAGTAVACSEATFGQVVVAGDSGGSPVFYVSDDSGSTWLRAGTGLVGAVRNLRYAPGPGHSVYAATAEGVFYAGDAHASWSPLGNLPDARSVLRGNWYHTLAASGTGVYYFDGTWRGWNEGLLDREVLVLDLQDRTGILFCGTAHSGLFRGFVPTGIEEQPGGGPERVRGMDALIPTTILRAPELLWLDCRVLDITGRDVTDRRGRLAPGVYFLKDEGGRLKDEPGGLTSVRKVILPR